MVRDFINRVMTRHWDIATCQCRFCRLGRHFGCGPVEKHLPRRKSDWLIYALFGRGYALRPKEGPGSMQ
jgi:hypothetical protein